MVRFRIGMLVETMDGFVGVIVNMDSPRIPNNITVSFPYADHTETVELTPEDLVQRGNNWIPFANSSRKDRFGKRNSVAKDW